MISKPISTSAFKSSSYRACPSHRNCRSQTRASLSPNAGITRESQSRSGFPSGPNEKLSRTSYSYPSRLSGGASTDVSSRKPIATHICSAIPEETHTDMKEEERQVSFPNKAGEVLAGILNDTSSKEAVILCHGLASHKNGFHLRKITEALAEKGMSSLRMDFTGNGDSEGAFRFQNIKEERADLQADDIHAAEKYLASIGKSAVGVLGHSKGGSAVLIHSATYGSIPKVANVSGRFNHKRGIKERFGDDVFERVEKEGGVPMPLKTSYGRTIEAVFDKTDLQNRLDMDMEKVCKDIPDDVTVLNIHGSGDSTIPVEDAHTFARLLPGSRLVVVEDANHNYTDPAHYQQLVKEVTQLFLEP